MGMEVGRVAVGMEVVGEVRLRWDVGGRLRLGGSLVLSALVKVAFDHGYGFWRVFL